MSLKTGTLPDNVIKSLASEGELITAGFDENRLKQACYELRASDVFYETASSSEDKQRVVDANGYVLRPQCYVTAIVQESIELPNDILGRIIAKGQLFSVGIIPVCTYADPGFRGRLGITLCNISHRHLVIRPGQAIAKIEFSKIPTAVENPYSGQHGFETSIWPIPTSLFAKEDDLKAHGINPSNMKEILLSYGPVVADLERRMRFYQKRVWIQIAIMLLTFLTLIYLIDKENWVMSVATGILANLVTTLGMNLLENRRASKG